MVFVQQLIVGEAVTRRGLSDNYVSAASTVTILAMIACVVGGWIGFTYSRRTVSDRALLLLACWGLSSAVGLALLFAFQPSTRNVSASPGLQAVADDFCATRADLSDAMQAVSDARSARALLANGKAALRRFDAAAVSFHDQAGRAADVGATDLAANLDVLGTDFSQLARALRAMDRDAVDASSYETAALIVATTQTWPISITC
jgi:hypothetical protein